MQAISLNSIRTVQFLIGQNIDRYIYFIEKSDRENIDGQHLRPPVLAIPLETIEREKFDIASLVPDPSMFSSIKKLHYTVSVLFTCTFV